MKIEKVESKEDAVKCNELLSKLIADESTFDNTLNKGYIVIDYFEHIYNKPQNIIFVAKENDNTVIGYAYCKITMDIDKKIALIDGIYVEEKYRNQGIATQIIEECKRWAAKMEAKILELNVVSKNENAINLYKKIGFDEFSKKMRLEL